MDNFSERFKSLKLQMDVTYPQIAAHLGLTQRTVKGYASGEIKPDYYKLIALADYFGATLDYLVGNSPFPDYSASEDLTPFPYLCERMKLLRVAKKMDIFDIAESLDISPRSYAGFEAGEVLPRLRTICLIADYFDVSIDYLIGRSDTPNSHEL